MSLLLLPALVSPLAPAALPVAPTAHAVDLERAARVVPQREARALGVGSFVGPASGRTLEGGVRSWRDAAGDRGVVVALVSVTCPVGKKLFPEIARAEDRARALGFGFVHVGVQGLDDTAALRDHATRFELEGPVLQDAEGEIARGLDARTTTEVFVVDASGTLRYRGAVHDQYGIGFELPAPRRRFLDDALAALAAGDEVPVPATTAPGCAIEPTRATSTPAAPVTYTRDVARLMQRSCVECHREGGVAPFRLDSYAAVSRRASMLLEVIDEGIMPPWFAAHGDGATGPWRNDRSLLPGERDLLARWIDAGKPEGDAHEAPLPRSFGADGWALGPPDAVVALPEPFEVPAEGRVDYQYFAVPTGIDRDRWVRAIEVRPGALDVVHHVVAYALPADAFENGRLRRWDLVDERRGFFAAWAPGAEPAVYPQGHARWLPANTVFLLEMHYTPNGTKRSDRSAVGLHFASEDPDYRPDHVVRTAGISNRSFRIPARASEHADGSTGIVTRDMFVTAFMPHMHLRGRSFTFEHAKQGGERALLLDVPRYDFNWQLTYSPVEPLRLAAGDRIDVRAVFDNSAGNPANPDPQRRVGWGPETDDEMLIGFINYVLAEEDHELSATEPQLVVLEPRIQGYLRGIAKKSGGVVPRAALQRDAHASFDRLDLDRNGELDATELTILD